MLNNSLIPKKNDKSVFWRFISIIRSEKNFLWITIAFFSLGILLGALIQFTFPELIDQFINQLKNYLEGIAGSKPSKTSLMIFIFLNNFRVAIMAFLLGIIFGIMPTLVLVFNGAILGVLGTRMGQQGELINFFISILPHGVFEIPAILFSCVAGYKMFLGWISKERELKNEFKESLILIVGSGLILLLAAFIEGFITTTLV